MTAQYWALADGYRSLKSCEKIDWQAKAPANARLRAHFFTASKGAVGR
jgi:hypothetical protein